jgi:phage gp36-like protein
MAYCTADNVRLRLPVLGNDVDRDAVIAEAISAAQAEVDGSLAGRYTVPFDPVPDIITHITADLAAAWTLDTEFSGGGEQKETRLSDTLRKRAQKRLLQIAEGNWRGTNTLVSRDTVPGQVERVGRISTSSGRPQFLDGSWLYGPGGQG